MTTFEHTFTWSVPARLARPETLILTPYDRPGLIPPRSRSLSVVRVFFIFEQRN